MSLRTAIPGWSSVLPPAVAVKIREFRNRPYRQRSRDEDGQSSESSIDGCDEGAGGGMQP